MGKRVWLVVAGIIVGLTVGANVAERQRPAPVDLRAVVGSRLTIAHREREGWPYRTLIVEHVEPPPGDTPTDPELWSLAFVNSEGQRTTLYCRPTVAAP